MPVSDPIPVYPTPTDQPLAVLIYQMKELRDEVKQGFGKIDGRLERAEERLTSVEIWQAGYEAREKLRTETESAASPDLVKVALGALGLAATVVSFFVGGGSLN